MCWALYIAFITFAIKNCLPTSFLWKKNSNAQ